MGEIAKFFKREITIFLVAIILVVSLLFLFALNFISGEKNRMQAELEIESVKLERVFDDKIVHTFSLIKSMRSQILENPHDKNHINDILRKFRTSPDLSETFSWTIFSWSDASYKITVDAEYGIMKKPFDLSIRDYISFTAKEPDKFHFGRPVLGSTSKKWMIPGGIGVVSKDGEYLGAITIGFEIDNLARTLRKYTEYNKIKFELVSEDGVPILYSNKDSFGASKNIKRLFDPAMEEFFRRVKSSGLRSMGDVKLLGEKRGFVIKKLEDYPFVFLLQYDAGIIESKIVEDLRSQSVQLFSILFGLSLLLILAYREGKQRQKILMLKQVAENANRAKSEFLSQTAHEFKNFIYGILGSAEIVKIDLSEFLKKRQKSLKNDDLDFESDLDFIGEIINSSNELLEFVNDMIDLNQADTGEFKIVKNVEETNIAKIIKQAIKLLNKRSYASNIKINFEIDKDLHNLTNLDPKRVKQIFVNLISNAVKYSGRGTEIKVIATNISDSEVNEINAKTGSSNSKRVKVIIKDQGFGMSEDEIKIALQKYQTIKNENSGVVDSLGLGLPIVKFLIEKQGGILEIKSVKKLGTEVVVIL